MTLKQAAFRAEESVRNTLKLIGQYGFEEVDLVVNRSRTRFFYLQSNEQIGVLIAYFNALRLNGAPKKHFDNHCFDVFMTYAKDMKQAIENYKNNEGSLQFWLPSFRADKENYAYILDCMCHEQETDQAILEAKYNELKKSKKAE